MEYFNPYLTAHLTQDYKSFDNAISSPTPHTNSVTLVNAEKERVVKAVQGYIKSKAGTALVLGGYIPPATGVTPTNDCYPGIDQYIQNTERKISKLQA